MQRSENRGQTVYWRGRGCQIPANMNNEIYLGCDNDHDDDADDYDDELQAPAIMEYKGCLHRDDNDGQKLT